MKSDMRVVSSGELLETLRGKPAPYAEYDAEHSELRIRDITVDGRLILKDVAIEPRVALLDCLLPEGITFQSGTFGALSIVGGEVRAPIHFHGGVFNGPVMFDEVDMFSALRKHAVSLGFWAGQFNSSVTIYRGAFRGIHLSGAALKGFSITDGARIAHNRDLDPYVEEVLILASTVNVLEVEKVDIGSLVMSGIFAGTVCAFSELKINQLVLKYLLNRSHLKFYRVSANPVPDEPVLSFLYSQLGHTRFAQMDFTGFKRLDIHDCSFVQVESSDTKWFSADQLEGLEHPAKQDIFRQLKHAMISQGNRVDEIMFNALEMDEFRRALRWSQNPWDLAILLFAKYTNNFGTNYVLPAVWIVVVAFIVLQCSLWATGLSFADKWGEIFTVMNPAHSMDYLSPKERPANSFIAIDFVGRVLISVLIYQLITPFRKFSRK